MPPEDDKSQFFHPTSGDKNCLAGQSEPHASEMAAIIKLMRLLGVATHSAKSIEQIFEAALAEICTHMGWPVGFGYIVEPPSRLEKFTAWCSSSPERYTNLQNVSVQIDFRDDHSLIGKVLSTRKPVLFEDINNDCFLRRREAQDSGLKSCLAVPILVQNKPAAILEFFFIEPLSLHKVILEVMESVASHIGLVIEHHREDKKLRALFDLAPDAEIVTNRAGSIVMANEQSIRLFGYAREELLDHPIEVLVPAERRKTHMQSRLNYASAPHPRPMGSGMELTALRKDETSIPVEVSLSPIALEDEMLIACAIRDISGRKELEEKFRETERLADVGTMAAIFAHEVASPLDGISTTVQLIAMKLPTQLQPLISDLSMEIRRLESLLNQFRSLSRLGDLKLKLINFASVIRQVLEINAAHWRSLGIHTITEVSGDLSLSADEEKLHQMILNLGRNAVEAMPSGGTLSINACCRGDDVILEISDTGCGISEDINIFQPFTTTKAQGTGLGLHIVHQIVSAHHGAITYRTAPGSGTTFEINLPKNRHSIGDQSLKQV